MSLIFFDGFDGLHGLVSVGSVQMQGKGWSVTGWGNAGEGRFTGSGCVRPASGATSAVWNWTDPLTRGFVGFAFKIQNAPAADVPLVAFLDGAQTQIGVSWRQSTGKLFVWKGTPATPWPAGETSIPVLTWFYLEFGATIGADEAGSIELRLNGSGTPEILREYIDTQYSANASFNAVALLAGSYTAYFDDFYFISTYGTFPLNTFLGDTRVQTLYPVGSGSSTQWSPFFGTNWQMVDDGAAGTSGLDLDASYNLSSTVGQIDLFQILDITGSVAPTIYSAALTWEGKKDAAALSSVRSKLKSGGTVYNGPSVALPTTYATYRTLYDKNPNGNVPWTVAAINGLEIGYENV